MDTNEKNPPAKGVTLAELGRRRGEFEVPEGAEAALKAGSDTPIVFLRATGEPYRLVPETDNEVPKTTNGETGPAAD